MDTTGYCMVMVSVGNAAEAVAIADALVTEKLAACIQIMPIQSVYIWEGKVEHDSESLVLIKTKKALFTALEKKVKQLHTYDTPEIISFNITNGSQPYLSWIDTILR